MDYGKFKFEGRRKRPREAKKKKILTRRKSRR